MHAVATIIFED